MAPGAKTRDENRGIAANASRSSGSPNEGRPSSDDVNELRRQVQQLTDQVNQHLATSTSNVLDRAKAGVADAMAEVGQKGQEAAAGVREVGGNLTRAIDDSLKRRPYTTLAMAFGLGYVFSFLSRQKAP
jgi:ElaB/YqjD/DUF883 family membrane-anchored ribosome-binding protein